MYQSKHNLSQIIIYFQIIFINLTRTITLKWNINSWSHNGENVEKTNIIFHHVFVILIIMYINLWLSLFYKTGYQHSLYTYS